MATGDKLVTLDGLKAVHDHDAVVVSDLKSALKSGEEQDAVYHLGFYLDENGDLCQVEEEVTNG